MASAPDRATYDSRRLFLETLEAIHDVSLIKGLEKRDPQKVADLKRTNPPVAHPVTCTR